MPVIRVQHNIKIASDYNVSLSIERVMDAEEAEEIGYQDNFLLAAYVKGLGRAAEELTGDDT
jgi:hypothetical protein